MGQFLNVPLSTIDLKVNLQLSFVTIERCKIFCLSDITIACYIEMVGPTHAGSFQRFSIMNEALAVRFLFAIDIDIGLIFQDQ